MSTPATPHVNPMALLATVLGIAMFALMDALMKRASLACGVYTAVLARNVLGAAFVAPVWLARGARMPERRVLRLHLLRGGLVAFMSLSFFWGLVRMPLAEAIAISFLAPLIALWLAAIHLGERIRPRAIVAALFGLAGVAVITVSRLGPGEGAGADAGWGIAAILLSSVLYAASLVAQRAQAQVAPPLEIAFSQNLVVTLILLPAAPWLFQMPTLPAFLYASGSAALASASLILLAWAYARAEAQVLLPIEYTAFLWSALIGWLWFAERVTAATLVGVTLIVFGVWQGTRNRGSPPVAPV